MRKILSIVAALTLAGLPAAWAINKIQRQGIKTAAECVAGGSTAAACLPAASQIWDDALNQSLTTTLAGIGGGGGGVTSVSGTAPIVSSGGATPAISIPKATSLVDGYLDKGDFATFLAKQPAGNYITALTGDVTASGPGSAAATISNLARSKLASGTASHVLINDGAGAMSSEAQLAISRGGTGQSTATNAFNALAPASPAKGSVIAHDGTNWVKVGVGTDSQVLSADSTASAGVAWKDAGSANIRIWDGYYNACSFTNTSGSYADLPSSSSGCTFNETTNVGFGTVTSYSGTGLSAKPGITFTPTQTGYYLVIVNTQVTDIVNAGEMYLRLTDGSSTLAETVIRAQSTTVVQPVYFTAIIHVTTLSSMSLYLQGKQSGGGPEYIAGMSALTKGVQFQIMGIH